MSVSAQSIIFIAVALLRLKTGIRTEVDKI